VRSPIRILTTTPKSWGGGGWRLGTKPYKSSLSEREGDYQ
jgi:hypothetical protein